MNDLISRQAVIDKKDLLTRDCPFCGSESNSAIFIDDYNNRIKAVITCTKCGAKMERSIEPKTFKPSSFLDFTDDLIRLCTDWNYRYRGGD